MVLTVRERMENYGIFENDAQNIEKEDQSLDEIRKEITDRAIAGDEEAYLAYSRIEKKVVDSRYVQARSAMAEVLKEFNGIISRDVRKSEESYEDQQCRVWIENDALYLKYKNIQNLLDSIR